MDVREREDQINFIMTMLMDWRLNDRSKLDAIPDADFARFDKIANWLMPSSRPSKRDGVWLDKFEARVQRLQRGLSYHPRSEAVKQ